MRKNILIATHGVPVDYHNSLIPRIINHLGFSIEWSDDRRADLIIYGPNFHRQKNYRWTPKPLRPIFEKFKESRPNHSGVTIFQTGENIRSDFIETDFKITFDLAVSSKKHIRLPYWMEAVDWSHEGIKVNQNVRFGRPIDLFRLTKPLGLTFLRKPTRIVLFSSHLREPRKTLFNELSNVLPVSGYGPYFDAQIKDHNSSNFSKHEILKNFAFNLCPENGMYPGYYTEKIPESFMGDSLPLTWVDENVAVDFNPRAFINLAPMMHTSFEGLKQLLTTKSELELYAEQPLMRHIPSIEKYKTFIKEIIYSAIS